MHWIFLGLAAALTVMEVAYRRAITRRVRNAVDTAIDDFKRMIQGKKGPSGNGR